MNREEFEIASKDIMDYIKENHPKLSAVGMFSTDDADTEGNSLGGQFGINASEADAATLVTGLVAQYGPMILAPAAIALEAFARSKGLFGQIKNPLAMTKLNKADDWPETIH